MNPVKPADDENEVQKSDYMDQFLPENLKDYRAIPKPIPEPYKVKYITAADVVKEAEAEGRTVIVVKGLEREIPVDIHNDLKDPNAVSLYKYCKVMTAKDPILILFKGEKVEDSEDHDLEQYTNGETLHVLG